MGACPTTQSYVIPVGSPVMLCQQQFDSVAAPSLPFGWSSVADGPNWVTSTANPQTPVNSAYAAALGTTGFSELISPAYMVSPMGGQMRFSTAFNLEDESPTSSVGHDGMVLEISINGAPFQDLRVAGGSFSSGGYNKTISNAYGSPIAGRQAWSGLSGGTPAMPAYMTVTVNLPVSAYNQTVRMKWLVATDAATSAAGDSGARIDAILGTACQPTAATVSLAGRVVTQAGNGVNNAVVTLTDETGGVRTVRTGSFGYYRFDELATGRTYVIRVTGRYTAAPRIVQLIDNLYDFDLIANE
jgi:hypothetical protein